MIPNPLLTNVLDFMKMDPVTASVTNMQTFGAKNGLDGDASKNNGTSNITTPTIESLLNSRNISSYLMGNSTLPLGAQIFTIPASLATFPNSDLIPVFVNSLGQMVLANTGNLLSNSLASLAGTLTSIQQLSANRDMSIFNNNQPQCNGILDHLMQQYQQLHMMKNSVLQQTWASPFQLSPKEESPTFITQNNQPPSQNHIRIDPQEKTNSTSIFTTPLNCSSNSLPSDKFHSTNDPSVDYRSCDNKSPSVTSSVSSRSVGNKINQMIDVSNDYILGQDDHLVKEKAAEFMRHSNSQYGFNSKSNDTNRYMGNTALSQSTNLDIRTDPNNEAVQGNQSLTVDGVDIGEIREFARNFKIKRLSMGLTQTQVGLALTATEGPAYSQSAICRFEKLDITPKSAQKIKPILEKWIKESEEKFRNGDNCVEEETGSDVNKKRKRRTSFTPQALDLLNVHFDKKSHPTGSEMRTLANELNYDREVIRVWFCNKRQALKNSTKRAKQSPENEDSIPRQGTFSAGSKPMSCDDTNHAESAVIKDETELSQRDQTFINVDTFTLEAEDLSIDRKENETNLPTMGENIENPK